MKTLVAFLLLWQATFATAFVLVWDAPPDYVPDSYILYHGTTSGSYSEIYSVGEGTNYDYTAPMPAGANYFSVVALAFDTNDVLQMSGLSSELVVTNSPLIVLTQVILTSTNPSGGWLPWSTNSVNFSPSLPQEFFKSSLGISKSNVITIPAPN